METINLHQTILRITLNNFDDVIISYLLDLGKQFSRAFRVRSTPREDCNSYCITRYCNAAKIKDGSQLSG